MYYGMIGAVLFLFVTPFFISVMLPDNHFKLRDVLIFWIKTGFYIFLGILLSSAYIVPYYFDFIKSNTMRVSQNYEASLSYETFFGTLSNFFMPFFSEIHGAFGGSSLFLIAAILPVLKFIKIRIPLSIWVIWGLLLSAFLYMQGARTPVHRLAWEYLPFASSVRGEGRISIIIPILIMLLLAWIIKLDSFSLRLRSLTVKLTPYMLLALLSLLLISLYTLLSVYIKPGLSPFHSFYIPRAKSMFGIFLCFVICIHIGWILRYGTFVAERYDQPSFDQMKLQKKATLDFPYHPGSGLFSSVILLQLNRSFLEPSLGKIYNLVIPVSSQDEAYDKMIRDRLPNQIFIENYGHEKAQSITEKALHMREGAVDLIYSSFNRLQFRVTTEAPAFFGLSYPYTGHWKAWSNGNNIHVYRANGASLAVEIPKGTSLIEFRYWSPAAFWGIIVSCITFVLIGLYFCLNSLNGFPKVIAAVFVLIIGIGGVLVWHHSLYSGDNLGTVYTWTYPPPKPKPNLAYGKKTSSFPLANIWQQMSIFYTNHRSKVVDGDKNTGSGYIINLENNPAVIIDLYQRRIINTLTIYESTKNTPVNSRQLDLLISQDENKWNKIASITSEVKNHHPIRIEFDSPKTARYVQIKASGNGILSLDEIEIY
jgi:hypothetical protein